MGPTAHSYSRHVQPCHERASHATQLKGLTTVLTRTESRQTPKASYCAALHNGGGVCHIALALHAATWPPYMSWLPGRPSSWVTTLEYTTLPILLFAGGALAKVCLPCWKALKPPPGSKAKPRVPWESLVRVDTGPMPSHLVPLKYMEAKFVAPFRPSHDMVLLKPKGYLSRPPDTCQAALSGHVYSFPQPCGEAVAGVFPCHPDDAPEKLTVVLLRATTAQNDIADIVARSPALQVGLTCGPHQL